MEKETRCPPCDDRFCPGGCPDAPTATPEAFVTPEDFFEPGRAAKLAAVQAASQARNAAQEAAYKAKQSAAVDAALAIARDGYRGVDPFSDMF